MSSEVSLFGRLRGAVKAFFRHDIAVHGGRIVLHDRAQPPAPPQPSRAEVAARREQRDLDLARRELADLLDADPSLRSTLRQLAFIEQALQKKGWRGLYKVPHELLQKALSQFEAVVTNWSPEGLACLRSKMAVALIDREHQDERETEAYKTAAVLDPTPAAVAAQAIEDARARAASGGIADAAVEDDDAAALHAAYAALGVAAPVAVEIQPELRVPARA
jgi:hypothetical protein